MEVRQLYAKLFGIGLPCEACRQDALAHDPTPGQVWRLGHIEFLYGLGIILVVIGHSLAPQWHDASHPFHNHLEAWIYSFHMPLFFFLSGYVGQLSRRGFWESLQRRALRLLLPYLVVNALYLIPKFGFPGMAINAVPSATWDFFHFLLYPHASHNIVLWFLPAIFITNMVFHPFASRTTWPWVVGITAAVLTLHFRNPFPPQGLFALGVICACAPLYWLGTLVSRHRHVLDPWSTLGWRLTFPVAAAAHGLGVAYLPQPHLATAAAGVFMCYALARAWRIPDTWIPWRAIARHSFQIYLLSGFGHSVARVTLLQILHLNVHIVSGGMIAAGLVAPLIAVALIRRFAPWLGLTIGLEPARPAVQIPL